ncbi:MAG: FIST N-terminal domain-containing protein [bacterium]
MTQLHVHAASGVDTRDVLTLLDHELSGARGSAHLVFAFYGCDHDDAALHEYLSRRFPGTPVIGGTSSGGLITHQGVFDETSIGVLVIDDADGDYGVAAGGLGADPAQSAEDLLQRALASCGCGGELPELIWVYQAPGHEEAVIEGLRRVVGDRCPIVGGSSADNDVTGKWRQLGPDGPLRDGLSIAVLFPSRAIDCAFQGGYEPSGPSGIVTGIGYEVHGESGVVTAASGREILSIDDAPASSVYNRWIGGRVSGKLEEGGTILAETTMCPLAVDAGSVDGVTCFLLVHPESVRAGGALTTFRELQVGDRIYAMKGDRLRLIDRAERVVEQARRGLSAPRSGIAGALVVYCGGCKLAVGDDIGKVATAIANGLGDAPFIGCFTFGEQGRLLDRNVHGNLMISAVAFGC